ncbi:MAG: polymer-forming cytoskeletal protein [Nitrospirae bacterium]|nr:polymer-forming cytoskeletal protein [Nitrospirota bacterium]
MWRKDSQETKSAEQGTNENAQAQDNGGIETGDNVVAFVGKEVEFKGVISYNGTVRIDGHMDGEIHTEGILLVGEEAVITAKVSAGTIVSKGKITGDIIAKEKIRLLSPAVLNGSVKTPMLSMEEGVLFNGNIEMARADVRELPRAVNAPVSAIKRA